MQCEDIQAVIIRTVIGIWGPMWILLASLGAGLAHPDKGVGTAFENSWCRFG